VDLIRHLGERRRAGEKQDGERRKQKKIATLRLNGHSPDSRAFEGDVPSHRGALQQNSIASDCAGSQIVGLAASRRLAFIR
jgi:hypothetical protein